MVKSLCSSLPEKSIEVKVCQLALKLMEKYYLDHGLLFLDALIAATALCSQLVLVTGNTKHFSYIPN